MVSINFSPINEIVLHEVISTDKDELIKSRVTPAGNFPLYWCNGILFAFSSLPWTDEIVSDFLKGRAHWAEIRFTKLDKYQPLLELNEETYKTTIKISVINTSGSSTHQAVTNWLVEQEKKLKQQQGKGIKVNQ
ncbi:MAG: hypothetical protein ACP5RQ_00500 [Candidatus Micrarchaeia archaeon]